MKTWVISEIMRSAYKHGQAYAKGQIYRSTGRFNFKCPEATGLPEFVVRMPIDDHEFLANVYRHAFRQGLKQGGSQNETN